jgi:uncharacterized protein YaaW (UPF0174 family)
MEDLQALLSRATCDQLQPLVDIMDTNVCQSASADQIILGIQWLHGNAFGVIYREAVGDQISYAQVLCSLLRKLDVACNPSDGCEALEEALVRKAFEPVWARLKQPERGELTQALEHTVDRLGKTREWVEVGGLAGLMIAGKLGGFGSYLMASTVIHGASTSIGVTLPFAFYKGVSSAISVALGPVGLVGLSVYAIYRLTGTNFAKLLPVALYISLLRYELAARPNKVLGRQVIPHNYATKRGARMF